MYFAGEDWEGKQWEGGEGTEDAREAAQADPDTRHVTLQDSQQMTRGKYYSTATS